MGAERAEATRIASLDQFRGYTVLGMFLVNFVGSYVAVGQTLPVLQHHHTYCSYADTIMPQFLFAVGFAYRLTLLRRRAAGNTRAAYGHVLKRNLLLILVAFVIYPLGDGMKNWADLGTLRFADVLLFEFKRNLFQTLTHIAVASLWVLPVIAARVWVRAAWAIGSCLLHLGLSWWFNYAWVNTAPNGIDGGVLGFLTWTIPLLVGSFACDVCLAGGRARAVVLSMCGGLALMALGYGLSCLHLAPSGHSATEPGLTWRVAEPPFAYVSQKPPDFNLFTMSQRSGSVSYLVFGAGFSLALYALFIAFCDGLGWQIGLLRTFGTNALAGYILHGLVADAVKPFAPKDAPLWYVAAALGVFLAICYVLLRYLEKQRLFLRL